MNPETERKKIKIKKQEREGKKVPCVHSLTEARLARIMNGIVRDLYSIKPISASRRWVLTERASKSLSDWRVEMSSFLDANFYNTMLVPPIFRRQRDVLQLTYWHATILAHRPFFLSNFARLSYQGPNAASDDAHVEESVRQCVTAAKMTVRAIDDIKQTRQMFRAFWVSTSIARAPISVEDINRDQTLFVTALIYRSRHTSGSQQLSFCTST